MLQSTADAMNGTVKHVTCLCREPVQGESPVKHYRLRSSGSFRPKSTYRRVDADGRPPLTVIQSG